MCKDNHDVKWELARKLVHMEDIEKANIFGTTDIAVILDMEYEDVQKKLEGYKREQEDTKVIRRGDEVTVVGSPAKGYVMGFKPCRHFADGMTCVVLICNISKPDLGYYDSKNLRKTGRHIKINELLEYQLEVEEGDCSNEN